MDDSILKLTLITLTGFVTTFFVMPSILEVAYKKKLFDVPDERKVHTKAIPSLGGVGIFLGGLLTYTIWGEPTNFQTYKHLLAAFLVLFFMGLKDDLILMSATKKLLIQFVVTLWLAIGGIRIVELHGFLGIETLNIWWSYIISIVFIIGIMNAFNLIDGIDGLAGGLGGINCLTLGAILYIYGEFDYAVLAFSISGALFAFLFYNFNQYPKKMFMGDTGSLLLGLCIAVLAIRFLAVEERVEIGGLDFISPPLVLFGIMFIPIFDTVRVIVIRLSKGKSPFTPDKNHLHHELLKAGADHKTASMILYIVNIVLVGVVLFFREMSNTIGLGLIILFVGGTILQVVILMRYRNRDKDLASLSEKLRQMSDDNRFLK